MIDTQRAEIDRFFEHSQRVELVGVDSEWMTEFFRGFEQTHSLVHTPRAFFGVRVDRDSRVAFVDGWEGFIDGLIDEVGGFRGLGVTDARGGGDPAGPLFGGGGDRVEHFEFVCGRESVPRFDLACGGALFEHRVEAGEQIVGQFFDTCVADCAYGGHDTAAGFEDFEVGYAALFAFPFIEAIAGPACVGVCVDECWHDDPTASVDDFGIWGITAAGADRRDGSILNQDGAVRDWSEVRHC